MANVKDTKAAKKAEAKRIKEEKAASKETAKAEALAMKAKEEKAAKAKAEKEAKEKQDSDNKGFVKMYSPRALEEAGEGFMFGHKAEPLPNGHTVVFVPEESVENEKLRGNALMSEKVYSVLHGDEKE